MYCRLQKKDHRWREECIAGLGAHCNNKSANYFTMKSWFPIKTKETTLSRNTHLVLLLFTQWAHTSSFYDTVGLYPLIYLHSGHHPHHLLYTDCPASFPLLLAQWAHTSSFYDTVGLYPPHLLTQWAPPLPSTVLGLSSLIKFLLSLYSGPISPNLWYGGPIPTHFLTQWTPHSPSTVHRLSSLNSSITCTVGPYLLIYDTVGLYPLIFLHSGHHPRHLLYTDCPA